MSSKHSASQSHIIQSTDNSYFGCLNIRLKVQHNITKQLCYKCKHFIHYREITSKQILRYFCTNHVIQNSSSSLINFQLFHTKSVYKTLMGNLTSVSRERFLLHQILYLLEHSIPFPILPLISQQVPPSAVDACLKQEIPPPAILVQILLFNTTTFSGYKLFLYICTPKSNLQIAIFKDT